MRWRGPVDHAHPAGVDVGRDDELRSSPIRSAIAVALPPGRGGEVGDPLPRLRVEHGDDRLARPGPAASPGPRATAGERARGRRCRARRARRGRARPRLDLDAGGAQLGREPSAVTCARVDAQRDRRRLVRRARARRVRSSAPSSSTSTLDDPVGVRAARPRRRPAPGTAAAETRAARAAHRSRSRGRGVSACRPRRPSRPPPRAAGRRAAAGTRRAAARRAPGGRARRAAASTTRREQVVEPALRAHGAVDELGDEGAVAVGEVGLRSIAGNEDVRERAVLDAHQRVERDAGGASSPACSRRRAACVGDRRPARHASAGIARAAFGLHLVELERAVAGRDARRARTPCPAARRCRPTADAPARP